MKSPPFRHHDGTGHAATSPRPPRRQHTHMPRSAPRRRCVIPRRRVSAGDERDPRGRRTLATRPSRERDRAVFPERLAPAPPCMPIVHGHDRGAESTASGRQCLATRRGPRFARHRRHLARWSGSRWLATQTRPPPVPRACPRHGYRRDDHRCRIRGWLAGGQVSLGPGADLGRVRGCRNSADHCHRQPCRTSPAVWPVGRTDVRQCLGDPARLGDAGRRLFLDLASCVGRPRPHPAVGTHTPAGRRARARGRG